MNGLLSHGLCNPFGYPPAVILGIGLLILQAVFLFDLLWLIWWVNSTTLQRDSIRQFGRIVILKKLRFSFGSLAWMLLTLQIVYRDVCLICYYLLLGELCVDQIQRMLVIFFWNAPLPIGFGAAFWMVLVCLWLWLSTFFISTLRFSLVILSAGLKRLSGLLSLVFISGICGCKKTSMFSGMFFLLQSLYCFFLE